MSHFAQVVDGIVQQVIVAEQDFIDEYSKETEGQWIQTSYNTRADQHPEGRPLRKNFAGKGFTYDAQRDAFIPPKPFDSWVLNEETCLWKAPVAKPTKPVRYGYDWDEENTQWVPAPPPSVSLTRLEFMLGLEDRGLLDDIESYIENSAPKRVKVMWKNASEFVRTNLELLTMSSDMGFTDEQLDDLFGVSV